LGDDLKLRGEDETSHGPEAWPERVVALVAEARDIVESPQFRTVAGMRTEAAMKRAALAVGPAADGTTVKLASLVKQMKDASEAALRANDGENPEVQQAAAAPEVVELCKLLFFEADQ
jgi:hypothetical protein